MALASKVPPRSNSIAKPKPRTSGASHLTETSSQRAVYPSLKGKRVLVTGGGSGIGAGIVEAFAAQGAEIIFFDIDEDGSSEVAQRTGAQFHRVDLTDTATTQRTIQSIVDQGGAIDVLVNNAAN